MASSPLQKGNFKEHFTPILKHVWSESLADKKKNSKRYEIFGSDTMTSHSQKTSAMGSMDPRDWNFRKHGRVQYAGLEPGFTKEWKPVEFAKGIQVDRALVDDIIDGTGQIPKDLSRTPQALAEAFEVFCETVAAEIFNFAFTDAGTTPNGFNIAGPDGVGLVSTAHPLGPNNSATQSNEHTLALTPDNLDTVCIAMENVTDDVGTKLGLTPTHLLVPTALRRKAREILESDKDPNNANNTVNTLSRSLELIVWPYLTDATAWFVLDMGRAKQHLLWIDRVKVELASAKDDDTQIYKWLVYARFDRGFDDWKWIQGAKP